jgi:hypothetical protein
MSTPLSFVVDIRPMFTEIDVEHMKAYGMDLSSRDDVEKHAANILSAVSSGIMPPPAENRRWTKEMCAIFERWGQEGYKP